DPDDEVEYVTVPGIKADFDYEQKGCPGSPLVVQFWDKSYGQGLSYEWTISSAAGTTAYVNQNPLHPFPSAGTYTVCLKVTAANGMTDQVCKTITVDTTCKPSFDYVYDACTSGGKFPQQVNVIFTNKSKGGFCPQTFDWRFEANGNFVNDNAQTVTHVYAPGQHAVSLRMSDNQSCETTNTQNINVQACVADFTYIVCPTGRVVFQTWVPNPEWSFPGGTPSSGSAGVVVVQYSSAGNYRVRLASVDKNHCRCVIEKDIPIPGIVKCRPNDTESGNYGFTYKLRLYQFRYKVTVRNKPGKHQIKAKGVLYTWNSAFWAPIAAREIRAELSGHTYTSGVNCPCINSKNADGDSGVQKLRAKAKVVKLFSNDFCVRDQEINATFTVKVDKSHTPVVRTLLVGFPTNKCKY
ncbi:MAG TPA: PKD domain-containing protein, partial [Pyrinomonadaceae bacterium]